MKYKRINYERSFESEFKTYPKRNLAGFTTELSKQLDQEQRFTISLNSERKVSYIK